MKTIAEQKFNELIKDVFAATLKPLWFRKKANNFYYYNGEVGKIINIQKSVYYSKDHINFTINIGIFSPEYWSGHLNYRELPLPVFPTESECVIRKRIGQLLNIHDVWFDITGDTEINEIKEVQLSYITNVILPYFNTINSTEELLVALSDGSSAVFPLAKLIILGELKRSNDAKEEFDKLMKSNHSLKLKDLIMEEGGKYCLG